MNNDEVRKRVDELSRNPNNSREEEQELMEKLSFLIDADKDYRAAEYLGGIYYEKRMYDQALKYYELAESYGSKWAWNGLGYIWYYGRTGQVDYEKAFRYFSKMVEDGNYGSDFDRMEARLKIADMYKNGYYVEKNWNKYVQMIEELYEEVKDNYDTPRPEVFTRLAYIRTKQGRTEEAVELYLDAKRELAERVSHNRFFGDLNRINWLENDLYKLIEFDQNNFDLYDLYYLLKEEHTVSFMIGSEKHEIESKKNGEEMKIRLDDKWYRNINDFFSQAVIDDYIIEAYYWDIEDFKIII
ncbi:MAG: sel1 repeat family protein [Erysipelotrichaceae bacterium]|nr:sel1 repeat family protein [Erysipelotrichaceae bacterium]